MRGSHDEILSAFANRDADILVGTQMIVKGHDFPGVTLVGVIAADMSLYASDYGATEELSAVMSGAGRAGRRFTGRCSNTDIFPDNYSIETASHQNYEEFYEQEIAYRALMNYPPVANMVSVLLQGRNQKELIVATEKMVEEIRKQKDKCFQNLFVIGPSEPPVSKINDVYRRIIYLKSRERKKMVFLKNYLEEFINGSQIFKNINIQFDFKA
ncbi:MAG: hypothetical protein ACLT2Z_05210 [Eubacterium sp.]